MSTPTIENIEAATPSPADDADHGEQSTLARSLRVASAGGTSAREERQTKFARKLVLSDAAVISCAVLTGQLIRFGGTAVHPKLAWSGSVHIGYTTLSVVLVALWMGFLALGSRSPKVTGRGFEEYVKLGAATLQLFGMLAIFSMLLHIDISRGYLAIALPLGLIGLFVTRMLWRRLNARRRQQGHDQSKLLVVGATRAAHDIAAEFAKDPWASYDVVGICTPMGPSHGKEVITVDGCNIPIVGTDEAVLEAVARTGVDSVALAATHHLSPVEIRRLMWELEAVGVDLMVAPGLIDIADQRLTSRPVAGMAIFEVAKPQYSRANSVIKRTFDVLFATAALIGVAPIMIATALAVKLTSPGPIFYRSERIGIDGQPFRMTKFRSMYADADKRQAELIAANGGNALYFKMKDDPRVTKVGKIIRKFSIDELPQFIDVLTGSMSVVGPRPQVRREVDTYDDLVSRRLLVKPGLTGLWQVSGRNDMQVEDAVRLDLSYVENWSLLQDLLIIAKTVRTVAAGEGAY